MSPSLVVVVCVPVSPALPENVGVYVVVDVISALPPPASSAISHASWRRLDTLAQQEKKPCLAKPLVWRQQ